MESIKDLLPSVLEGLQNHEQSIKQKIWDQWAGIIGPRWASHTRPSLGKSGLLFVWVDQSVLAFELSQKYRQTILKRAQAVAGEQEVKEVLIRVGQLR